MDLLEKLNIPSLPEQQTQTDHPSIVKALEADPGIRLGFDVCLTCAKKLIAKPIFCKNCRRVKYCSAKCRSNDEGHGAVVCSLLKLCNDDEDVEERLFDVVDDDAAQYRVLSELQSYPATLANIIMDGPIFHSLLRSKKNKNLTIHIIGATEEAELWGANEKPFFDAYTDALTQMAETHLLASINLVFIGPSCKPFLKQSNIKYENHTEGICRIRFEGVKSNYNEISESERSDIDLAVLFNPGLTCPDYDWNEVFSTIKRGVHYILATNTELEALMDVQWLYRNKFIPGMPDEIIEMLKAEKGDDNETMDRNSLCSDHVGDSQFFGFNPNCGMRVRQSGNFANDLFVKNQWVLGGVLDKPRESLPKNKKRSVKNMKDNNERISKKSKKKKRKKNAALI